MVKGQGLFGDINNENSSGSAERLIFCRVFSGPDRVAGCRVYDLVTFKKDPIPCRFLVLLAINGNVFYGVKIRRQTDQRVQDPIDIRPVSVNAVPDKITFIHIFNCLNWAWIRLVRDVTMLCRKAIR